MENMSKTITVDAKTENLAFVMEFVETFAQIAGFSEKEIRRLLVVCDEIFSNIVKYAYPQKKGEITVKLSRKETTGLAVEFVDRGIPFNPLQEEEADVGLPLEKRPVGKLGLKIVKVIAKSVRYAYCDGKNILTIELLQG
ncbi:MAG: ATP-binding protein [Christensenella sp.]|nr:ATP-binding protein [Christensenella sp.]